LHACGLCCGTKQQIGLLRFANFELSLAQWTRRNAWHFQSVTKWLDLEANLHRCL
jgi:hypothetical protein